MTCITLNFDLSQLLDQYFNILDALKDIQFRYELGFKRPNPLILYYDPSSKLVYTKPQNNTIPIELCEKSGSYYISTKLCCLEFRPVELNFRTKILNNEFYVTIYYYYRVEKIGKLRQFFTKIDQNSFRYCQQLCKKLSKKCNDYWFVAYYKQDKKELWIFALSKEFYKLELEYIEKKINKILSRKGKSVTSIAKTESKFPDLDIPIIDLSEFEIELMKKFEFENSN